jgi:small subunit ribosomal protein S2
LIYFARAPTAAVVLSLGESSGAGRRARTHPNDQEETRTLVTVAEPTAPIERAARETREPQQSRDGAYNISMKGLLEAGVHFGHQTKRWNPKMRPYIFTERNGIHIIDLQQTVQGLQAAMRHAADVAAAGGKIIFVGTKKQAQDTVREEAERAGMFYVNKRWLGGMLTNFSTMKARLRYLHDLEARRDRGEFDLLPKAESIKLTEQITKLNETLGGIKDMRDLPAAVFIVDPHRERIAITEAIKLGIPVIAMVDTNCDPDEVDYVIPSNDDAIRAVRIVTAKIADAVNDGLARRESARADAEAAEDLEYAGLTQGGVFEPDEE